jgi:hypothetical protein
MLSLLLVERERKRKRKRKKKWLGGIFPKVEHALLAVLRGIFVAVRWH